MNRRTLMGRFARLALSATLCRSAAAGAHAVPERLVAIGDSITAGYGVERSWAALVSAQVGLPLDNRAVSGSDVAGQWAGQITIGDIGPLDRVLWLTGFNDCHTYQQDVAIYQRRLRSCLLFLRASGSRIVVAGCLPMRDGAFTARAGDAVAFSRVIADEARFVGAGLADLSGYDLAWAPDGAHPDQAGHAWLALRFTACLTSRVLVPMVLGP